MKKKKHKMNTNKLKLNKMKMNNENFPETLNVNPLRPRPLFSLLMWPAPSKYQA